MARTVSPLHTSRRSSPTQRHSSSSTSSSTTTTIPATTSILVPDSAITTNTTAANIPVTTSTIATTDSTNILPNRIQTLYRAAERSNVPIAPASSNTSSPIYSTTSSPPISPGISQYSGSSLGSMAPSRSDSRGVALAMEMPPSSTPTGRISKAKKGKRVHACEFPGCGKIFTRAEHKRRHELNHNPDATYRCPQAECGRSFHRLDLLQRHQERHDLEASTQPSPPSARRYPSQTTVLPESAAAIPPSSGASPQMPQPQARPAGNMSIMSMINNQQHPYHPMTDSTAYPMHPYIQLFTSGDGWDPIYVPDHSQSPRPRAYHQSNMSSTSSVASFDHSTGSPMIPTSLPQTPWTQAPPPNVLPHMFGAEGMSPYDSLATVNSQHIPLSNLDGREWSEISRELSAVSGLLSNPSRNGVSERLRSHCWDLYWQCFHPTYPIVHRPSMFIGTKPPPLLACAMVAIGSHYDILEDAKEYSLALLEIATKILRNRPSSTSKNARARIVDLQTIVLLEILSTFCARQISVQMSAKFRTMFANLSQVSIAHQPLAVYRANRKTSSPAKLADAQKFWIENETRSRIRHACTILDSQHTIFFDQAATIHRPKGAAVTSKELNLPCDDDLWDAASIEQWAQLAEKHEYIQIINGSPVVPSDRKTGYSYFQQQAINAQSLEQSNCKEFQQGSLSTVDHTLLRSEFDYHAVRMCKSMPIRQLLVLTGESWVLGRKVERRADYDKAKKEVHRWLNGDLKVNKNEHEGLPKVKKLDAECVIAFRHALKLLRLLYVEAIDRSSSADIFRTTHMLHENWAVYLACLVCWVQGQRKSLPGVNAGAAPVMPAEPSCLNDRVRATNEADTYFFFTRDLSLFALQNLEPAVLRRTQGLLECIRTQKIKRHMMGGLMHDAEQVLLKLIQGKHSILISFEGGA